MVAASNASLGLSNLPFFFEPQAPHHLRTSVPILFFFFWSRNPNGSSVLALLLRPPTAPPDKKSLVLFLLSQNYSPLPSKGPNSLHFVPPPKRCPPRLICSSSPFADPGGRMVFPSPFLASKLISTATWSCAFPLSSPCHPLTCANRLKFSFRAAESSLFSSSLREIISFFLRPSF